MKDQEGMNRRQFLQIGALGLAFPVHGYAPRTAGTQPKFAPFPLTAVRLKPSPFLTAVEANRTYLHKLEPDRFLRNFRVHAGLEPKADPYGGWEADTIAGHSLGHYLTACALMHAQTGDEECRRRVGYIVDELRECQIAAGDGYVAGFTRTKDGKTEDGKTIFPEIMRGEIRAAGFNLNGCWVPFYNWHKLFSGLFAAREYCGSTKALEISIGLASYISKVLDAISDEQLQTMLNCEHGGINESFAELFAITGNKRWLVVGERIRHKRTLGPMFAREDKLAGLHANTQIPKVIGLARLLELTGKEEYRVASRFFWETVTGKYSYVIGGNSDREYFQTPNTISKYITDQTCESCNTYNMLKLTRHLFADQPNGAYFDYYERAHFNHILAQQNPKTGMFAYMIPLMSGAAREFSSEFNDFWCCVGSGMESHSKHGESIYWKADRHLLVNLFIPSIVDWSEQGAKLEIDTEYPISGSISVSLASLASSSKFAISMRIPAWAAEGATIMVNRKPVKFARANGYATIERKWRKGDRISLNLPIKPRLESTMDDAGTVAVLFGPLVLAADLGPASKPYDGDAPALVGNDLAGRILALNDRAEFKVEGASRPGDLVLVPFYRLWESRTAVYFRKFTEADWSERQRIVADEKARLADLERRSIDVMRLGDPEAERVHSLVSKISYGLSYRMRQGRDARSEGFFEFRMKTDPELSQTLRATYWGEERRRTFYISVDGTRIATENLGYEKQGEFVERDYPIPTEITKGKTVVTVRFEPEKGHTAGPVFGCLLFKSN